MNTYEIAEDGRDFRLVEKMPDGHQSVIGRFATEEDARSCLLRRLTAMNAASLALWVLGNASH